MKKAAHVMQENTGVFHSKTPKIKNTITLRKLRKSSK
jgi:hypothetical protein